MTKHLRTGMADAVLFFTSLLMFLAATAAGSTAIKNIFMKYNSSLKMGTISGTLLTIIGAISWAEVERTLVLGAIGSAVSFLVAFFLKKTIDLWHKYTGRSQ